MAKFPYRGVVLTVYGGMSYKRAETIKDAENKAHDQYNELEKAGYPIAKAYVSDTKGNLIKDLTIMKNPAPKRKTSARTQSAAESYVRRKSQATGKSPSKRLVNRRIKNLRVPEGVFPNPASRVKTYKVETLNSTTGKWRRVATFEKLADAKEYANAYARQKTICAVRVVD